MSLTKFYLAILVFVGVVCLVTAKGKLTWSDQCSVLDAAGGVLVNVDEDKLCDSDNELICTGTCVCPPTRVWDKGFAFGLFGTGSCVVAVNGPCSKDDRCVSNAECDIICKCKKGYRPHESQCVSSSSKISGINGLAFVGMILSYYMFTN